MPSVAHRMMAAKLSRLIVPGSCVCVFSNHFLPMGQVAYRTLLSHTRHGRSNLIAMASTLMHRRASVSCSVRFFHKVCPSSPTEPSKCQSRSLPTKPSFQAPLLAAPLVTSYTKSPIVMPPFRSMATMGLRRHRLTRCRAVQGGWLRYMRRQDAFG